MRRIVTFAVLMAAGTGGLFGQLPAEAGRAVLTRMDSEAQRFAQLSRQIWELSETGFQEAKSAALLAAELRQAGFRVESSVAGMPTAFIASWGEGKPVIAILGEYDALPGMSQEAVAEKKPRQEGRPGHACGHNLFGVAAAHAAVAAQRVMEERKLRGTLRFYGTPAEEGGGGKIYLLRAGALGDVDAVITWHPWDFNAVSGQTWLATRQAKFRFHGKAAHAAAAPHAGRSALDAVMVMTHAVELLREHVPQETRLHYIVTSGGTAPNIVPEFTELRLIARHPDAETLERIWERVVNCARAGALATGTEMSFEVTSSYANTVINDPINQALDRNLRLAGGVRYTPDEQRFAEAIRASLSRDDALPMGSQEQILPVRSGVFSASTDVGDVSWNMPTGQFLAATWVPGTPAHSWQSTAASGMSIGQKGMLVAAKALALTALDLLAEAKLLEAAKADFQQRMAGRAYQSAHPPRERAGL